MTFYTSDYFIHICNVGVYGNGANRLLYALVHLNNTMVHLNNLMVHLNNSMVDIKITMVHLNNTMIHFNKYTQRVNRMKNKHLLPDVF